MSKMDRMLNSKKDKQTIYEIYRACRLCGAGAGYKMPIIQNVVDLDDSDVELKQKIRDCVQIEVHQDDKMPPLICELCVDKVNDFYEFFEMCRQTNKRTRLRLGLPPQSMPRGALDAGECILGLTEPVYVNDDSDGEPLAKHKKLQPKVRIKREPELKVKVENSTLRDTRISRHSTSRRPRTPPRITRHSQHSKEDTPVSRLQDKSKSSKTTPKSILKKESKIDDNSLLTPRLKRSRDKELVKLETPTKRVKIAIKSSPSTPKSSPRNSKSSKFPKTSPPKRAPSPPRTIKCPICGQMNKTPQSNSNHMRIHVVAFTSPKLACNPCGLWFQTADEAASHRKYHKSKNKPYNCRRCTADFRHLSVYDEHLENNQCIPWPVIPDVKCEVCWHLFPTNKLLEDHRCLGEEHRPGGKCRKCNRSYALLRNLKKHEPNCTAKNKSELVIDPGLLGKLKPFQIRVSRCDPLLKNIKQEHYDVSSVTADFGLDKNCVYPYISSVSSLNIKSEPNFDGMVSIKDDVKEEFCTEADYVHWDSEKSDSDDDISCQLVLNPFAKKRRIDSLAILTLKTIFSQKCLGRVPRKRRRVKQEKSVFDSILSNDDDKVTRDINNIIDNLGKDDNDLGDESENNSDGDVTQQKDVECEDGNEEMNKDDDKIIIFNDIDEKSLGAGDETSHNGDDNVDGNDADKSNAQIKDADDEISNNNVNPAVGIDSEEKNDTNDVENKNLNGDSIDKAVRNHLNDASNGDDSSHDVRDNIKNDDDNVCNDVNCSNNDRFKLIEDNINDGSTNISVNSKYEPSIVKENVEIKVNEVENKINDAKFDLDDTSSRNDLENSQDSNSIGTFNESLLNDNTQSDVISECERETEKDFNAKCNNDNAMDVASQQDDFSIENLSQDSKMSNIDLNLDSIDDSTVKNDTGDEKSCNIENDLSNDDGDDINKEKNSKNTDSDDMDDSKLLEALDAQIGENVAAKSPVHDEGNGHFVDRIALEDLISSKPVEKPLELDVLHEEFNFDA